MKFSSVSLLMWNFQTYDSLWHVIDAIQALEHEGGNTYTASALSLARNRVFGTSRQRWRLGARRAIVLMTDGLSTVHREDTHFEASLLRTLGIDIYVVAIGKYIDEAELRSIATAYDTHLIHVTDFSRLKFIQDSLIHRLCDLPDPPPPTDTSPGKKLKYNFKNIRL